MQPGYDGKAGAALRQRAALRCGGKPRFWAVRTNNPDNNNITNTHNINTERESMNTYYVLSEGFDPRENLALEEYIINNCRSDEV